MTLGVAFVLILSFAVGFMTGSKLSTHEGASPPWEGVVPGERKAIPKPSVEQKPSLPSTPIFIIPQKPQSPVVSPSTPPTGKPPQVKPGEKSGEAGTKPAGQKPSLPSAPISIIPEKPQPPVVSPSTPPTGKLPEVKPGEKPKEVGTGKAPQEVKPAEKPQQESGKMFRVMVGPMGEDEAKKLREKLRGEGKEALLIPTENGYKLQIGAFLQRENAEALVNELKKQGYSPSLEER